MVHGVSSKKIKGWWTISCTTWGCPALSYYVAKSPNSIKTFFSGLILPRNLNGTFWTEPLFCGFEGGLFKRSCLKLLGGDAVSNSCLIVISIVRKTDDEPKDEPDDSVKDDVKKDEGSDSDKEGVSMKKKEEAEAVEVRDVSYNLEILVSEKTLTFWLKHSLIFLLHWKIYPKSFEFLYLGWGYTRKFMFFALIKDRYHHLRKQLAMKERNLKIRNVTWVFAPVPQRLVLSIFLFSSKNNLYMWKLLFWETENNNSFQSVCISKKYNGGTAHSQDICFYPFLLRIVFMASVMVCYRGGQSPTKMTKTVWRPHRVGRQEWCIPSRCSHEMKCLNLKQYLGWLPDIFLDQQ